MRQALEAEGYEVREAPNGDVGSRLFREAPFDLIITDIVMPEKDGLGLIYELLRDFPDGKVFAISGDMLQLRMDPLSVATLLGARRTFAKPLDVVQLLDAVREELQE